jgi:hypothetical protein
MTTETDGRVVLECGCEMEMVNCKPFWFYCEEHDVDSHEDTVRPITKFRKSYED